jgi:hypothetical protein
MAAVLTVAAMATAGRPAEVVSARAEVSWPVVLTSASCPLGTTPFVPDGQDDVLVICQSSSAAIPANVQNVSDGEWLKIKTAGTIVSNDVGPTIAGRVITMMTPHADDGGLLIPPQGSAEVAGAPTFYVAKDDGFGLEGALVTALANQYKITKLYQPTAPFEECANGIRSQQNPDIERYLKTTSSCAEMIGELGLVYKLAKPPSVAAVPAPAAAEDDLSKEASSLATRTTPMLEKLAGLNAKLSWLDAGKFFLRVLER